MDTLNNDFPIARAVNYELTLHDDVRTDPYFWLNERDNEEVLAYLNAENNYLKQQMTDTDKLQKELFNEIKNRIKEDDESVPAFKNGYWYYLRYASGHEHPIYCRKKGSLDTSEEILLDVNIEATHHKYYQAGGIRVSPDNRLMVFAADNVGRRIYTLCIKDLTTGKILSDSIPNTSGSASWANDNKTIFYTVKNEALRAYRIYRHKLGTSTTEDVLVYEETDETYMCFVYKTKSQKFLVIGSGSTLSNEYRYLDASHPEGEFKLFQLRESEMEYSIAHFNDYWYIHTNKDKATNFKLMRCPIDETSQGHWEEVIPHRDDIYLENIELFKDFLVIEERENGLNRIIIKRWDNNESHAIAFDEETYTAGIGNNPEFDTEILRYGYSSLTIPSSVIDYNMITRKKTVMKQQEVVGGYNAEEYHAERVWAEAPDGVKVPISLVYKKALLKKEGNPLLLYGYGAYGITVDPGFSSTRLSLLDRGFVFAIAHVRGGEYLGRKWYEQGRMLHKKNTFTDFIACAEFLVHHQYTSVRHLYAMGGSAGGLLIGAVINMRPDLFKGVIAAVPFVDVLTTMLDTSIPLTTGEYNEWGNPNDPEYYHYIRSYSPYDNVEKKDYPAILITTGLYDSQVQYWEPAKWAAKMRRLKTDKNPLYLHTNMNTGHSGASGRYEGYRETALEYAFLLKLEGLTV